MSNPLATAVRLRPLHSFAGVFTSIHRAVIRLAPAIAFLTLIILWTVNHLARVLSDITVFPGFEGDGPYQMFNPLRRIAAGQTGGVDFQYFHGIGLPYLHYPIYALGGKTIFSAELARHTIAFAAYLGTTLAVFAALTRRVVPTLALTAIALVLTDQLELFGLSRTGSGMMGVRSMTVYFMLAVLLAGFRPKVEAAIVGVLAGAGLLLGVEHGVAAMAMVGVVWLARRFAGHDGGSIRWAITAAGLFLATAAGCLLAIGGREGAIGALRFAFLEMPRDQFWYFGVPPWKFHFDWIEVITDHNLMLRAIGPFAILLTLTIRRMRSHREDRPVLFAVLGLLAYGLLTVTSYFGYCSVHYLESLTRVALFGGLILAWRWWSVAEAESLGRGMHWVLGLSVVIFLLTGPSPRESSSVFHLPARIRTIVKETRTIRDGECKLAPNIQWELDQVVGVIDADRAAKGITRPPVIWSMYAGRIEEHYGVFNPGCDYAIHALGPVRREQYRYAFLAAQPDFVLTFHPPAFGWEPWLRNSTWEIYEEVVLNYDSVPTKQKRFSVWKRKPGDWRTVDHSTGRISRDPESLDAFSVPAPPGMKPDAPRVVEVEYEIHNPLASVPMIGGLPRYLLAPTDRQALPISLPPYRTTWSFPIFPNAGQTTPMVFVNTFSLVGGSVRIKRVHIRPLDITPDQVEALLE